MKKKIAAIGLTGLLVLATGVEDVVTSLDNPADKKTTVAYPKHWDPRVLPIVEFVQQTRGLTFKHPVPVNFLDDAGFDKQVAVKPSESKKDKADLELSLGELRALGLISGRLDLEKELDTLLKSDVIGLYVPSKHAVFVRGTSLDPYTRVTLAHELTHVLQDQYFDLTKLKKAPPGGDTTAVTALIEGDAVRIQNVYEKRLSKSDQALFATAEKRIGERSKAAVDVPQYLQDFLSFPYVFGPVLLDALSSEGGNKGVDRAFRNPPTQEAQVVDPVGHPLTEKARKVAAPSLPAGSKKLDDVVSFGQVSLFEVLGSRLGYTTAWDAVRGWQGDASVPYKQGSTTCMAIDVVTDGAESTGLLVAAAKQWAVFLPGATAVTQDGLVKIRACDPGVKAKPLPKTAVSAFTILQARASIIDELLKDKASFDLSACVADGVIAALGTQHQEDLAVTTLSPDRLAAIQQLFGTVAQTCRSSGHA
ncbi:MAG: hypothetical protein JWO12_3313 [Frankiales bacterium]|nr:hypothetical protein [Frankiales bacterium]